MAWVTVRQATELTGKARSSLYRDMAKGRVSYRTEADGGRVVDTSELIRVYGELRQDETHERDELRLSGETEKNGLRRVDRGDKSTQGGGGRATAGNAVHETAGTQTGDSRDPGRNTAPVVAVGKTLTRCACPTGDGHAMNCVPVTGY